MQEIVRPATQFGPRGRLGMVVPSNNAVIEPEFWSALPRDTALYVTRRFANGELTRASVCAGDAELGRAAAELAAVHVDVVLLADMVTSFLMEAGWNERRIATVTTATGAVCASAWTALRDALMVLGARRIALSTPYPPAIHALALDFFAEAGITVVGHATMDIPTIQDAAEVRPERMVAFVRGIRRESAQAVVQLGTHVPSFAAIVALEQATGLPVVTSNQALMWRALRLVGNETRISGLGQLLATH